MPSTVTSAPDGNDVTFKAPFAAAAGTAINARTDARQAHFHNNRFIYDSFGWFDIDAGHLPAAALEGEARRAARFFGPATTRRIRRKRLITVLSAVERGSGARGRSTAAACRIAPSR